jgi:hypothetical protein
MFIGLKKIIYHRICQYGEPPQPNVNDQVSRFTIAQMFSALQSDVTSVSAYKARLIQQNPGYQTSQVTSLFPSYNY